MTASGTINKLGDDSPMINSSNLENINRYFNTEVGLTYSAKVGGSSIESKLIAERRMNELSVLRIPHWYKGLKGRLDYGLNSTYFASFVFSYQGSEQFPSGNRYGFFPALSLGWVVLNQEAVHVKLRGSAGITGNDFDSFTSPAYFAYLERFGEGDNFRFGTDVQTAVSTLSKLAEENEDITWSKTKKYDLGFDASLIGNALSVTADYFFERTDDILVGGTPGVLGMNYLYPFGVVENKGIEGIVTWSQKLSNDFNFYLSANGTYAKSKIIDQNEEVYEYEWQFRTGHPVGSLFGYVFDRFITEKDNINSLPDQSRLGSLIPGSLKYKDLNNDNVIDEKDISYMGTGNFPEIWYGFSGGFDFKGFDFNFHLTGVANRTIMYAGDFAFAMNGKTGSVNEWHLERWQQGDGQNATYPGLSILNFGNNMVPSDFWTANGNFLRLQSVQLGYTFSKGVVKKLGLENLRLFVNCSNLMTWSDVKQIDPAGQGSGASYPISPTCTGGFNLSF
jgi:TonB-linked SusC/RagA family outer membrane protein